MLWGKLGKQYRVLMLWGKLGKLGKLGITKEKRVLVQKTKNSRIKTKQILHFLRRKTIIMLT